MSSQRKFVILIWTSVLASVLLIAAPAVFHAAPQASGYRVIRNILLGGEGGWDYVTVDPDAKRVYIPPQHGRSWSSMRPRASS